MSFVLALAFLQQNQLEWSSLASLEGNRGLAGIFAGVSGPDQSLLIAGGADSSNAMPREGANPVWTDQVWGLNGLEGEWESVGTLPFPLAHGSSLPWGDGFLVLGGNNSKGSLSSVFQLLWDGEVLSFEDFPPLPKPSSFHCSGKIGTTVFVLPGQLDSPPAALIDEFWSFNLAQPETGWKREPLCPGGPRIKASAAVQTLGDGREGFFVFGGEHPEKGVLSDAWVFLPGEGWRALASSPLPKSAAGIHSIGQSHILLFSGGGGPLGDLPQQNNSEYPSEVFAYHTITDTWAQSGAMPRGMVAGPLIQWNGSLILISEEIRSGVRTSLFHRAEMIKGRGALTSVDLLILVLYLTLLVGMGIYFARRTRGSQDFFLAGRRVPGWAAGLSIFGTQLSAITFLATPALAYATDLRYIPTWISILLVAPLIVYGFLPMFRRLSLATAYEYLERRFSLAVRMFGCCAFLIAQLARTGVVVFLPSLALATVTGFDIRICILSIGVLATLYTTLGGMEAVVWTDVLQVFVLVGGVLVALGIAISGAGGVGPLWDLAQKDSKFVLWDGRFAWTETASWSLLLGSIFLMIPPYATDQAIVQRYMSTPNEKAAARGVWLNGWLSIPAGILFPILGACLYAFYKAQPEKLLVGMPNDGIFPLFIGAEMPVGLTGLVIAGLFAATMSSLDSSMHSIGTVVVNDFHRRFGKLREDSEVLKLARKWTMVAGFFGTGCALLFSTWDVRSLFLFFLKSLGLLSSGLAGVFLLGLFTHRAHAAGVLVGAFVSALALGWASMATELHTFWFAFVGMGTCVTVGWLASLLIPNPDCSDFVGAEPPA